MGRNGSGVAKTRLVLRDYGDRVEIVRVPVDGATNGKREHSNGVNASSMEERYPWLFAVDPESLSPLNRLLRQVIEFKEGQITQENGGNGVERG